MRVLSVIAIYGMVDDMEFRFPCFASCKFNFKVSRDSGWRRGFSTTTSWYGASFGFGTCPVSKGYIRDATGSAILPGMEGSDVHLHVVKPTNWAMCSCKKLHW
jgi:hypothetical protein